MKGGSVNACGLVPEDWVRLMPVRPCLSSESLGWRSIAAFRFKYPSRYQLDLPSTPGHYISAHLNNPCKLSTRWSGTVRKSRSVPGDIIIMGAHQENSWDWIGEIDELQMFLDPELIMSAAAEISDRPFSLLEGICIRDPFVSALAARLVEEMSNPGGGTACFSDVMAQSLTWHLLRQHSTLGRASSGERIDIPSHKVRAAIDFIVTHVAEDASIDDMANAVNMSPFRFARGFKKATGQSPYQFLISKRVEFAQDLLRSTDQRLADIARAVGFSTQSQFTAAFRRRTQSTPGFYRVMTRGGRGPLSLSED